MNDRWYTPRPCPDCGTSREHSRRCPRSDNPKKGELGPVWSSLEPALIERTAAMLKPVA